MNRKLLLKIREIFHAKLQAKTGWGRNEIMELYNASVNEALLEAGQERELAAKLAQSAKSFEELWAADDFAGILGQLRELRPAVDAFFDNVMVMCDAMDVRLNRLNLLKSLVDRLGRVADFAALQV